MPKEQFNLENFKRNEDGSYSKISVGQPREKKVPFNSVNAVKSAIDTYKLTGMIPFDSNVPESKFRTITLTLFGEPMPKQSVRSFIAGKKIMHFQPKEMVAKKADYVRQINNQLPKDFVRFEEEVHITKLQFIFSPLKGFHKVKGKMDAIREGEVFYKTTKPDIDNLQKNIYDALNDLIFKDDSIIVSLNNVDKRFGIGGCIIIELKG